MSTLNVLQIHSSGSRATSVTRHLSGELIGRLIAEGARVATRDLADGMPFVDEDWIAANFTPAGERTADQTAALSFSDSLIAELKAADVIVIGAPVYNFGAPAVLKAWIDQVMRARVTFQYTDKGPVGLLKGKRAVIITASGGTRVGSPADFAVTYLKFALAFMGITDVSIIAADERAIDADAADKRAQVTLEAAFQAVLSPLEDAA